VGRVDEIEDWQQRAELAQPDAPAPGLATSVAGGAALVRSIHRLAVGDVPAAVASARHGLVMEPADGSQRSATAYYFGVASFYLDPLRAEPYLLEFIEGSAEERDPRHRYAMALLAETYGVRGDMDQARRFADQALELTRRWGLEEHPPTNQVHVAHGIVALAGGDLDLAEEHFERAVTLARRGHDRVEIAHTLLWMARFRVSNHDREGAREALDGARDLVPDIGRVSMQRLVQDLELELADHRLARNPPAGGDSLSEAELRVLRLLPGELSYRELGQRMHLSLNTRTHLGCGASSASPPGPRSSAKPTGVDGSEASRSAT
jgi:LuxR family transcriptional regulator, maltose regulon positive regulatory protein